MEFRTKPEEVSPKATAAIVKGFDGEPHLLPVTAADIEQSLAGGLALVIVEDDEPIAFTRLVPLVEGWYELGSTWVRSDCRGRKLNHRMYEFFLPLHREKNILATTTNPASLAVGRDVGMVLIARKTLPPYVWRATCSFCPASKIGTIDVAACRLAWQEDQCTAGPCWIRVTAETAQRFNLASARMAA